MAENLDELIDVGEEIFEKSKPYTNLMMKYNCALLEVKTKLDVLSSQLSVERDSNPFEAIHTRIKSPKSVIENLKRKGFART